MAHFFKKCFIIHIVQETEILDQEKYRAHWLLYHCIDKFTKI